MQHTSLNLNTQDASIHSDASIINLPHQLEPVSHIAVDIGGSLAKVVWFTAKRFTQDGLASPTGLGPEQGGKLHFCKFETTHIDQMIDFIDALLKDSHSRVIEATGGGAHKFHDLLVERLHVKIHKEDEMECLITGLNFLLRQIDYEAFTYDERRQDPMQFEESGKELFPYLLVNIGSGVSIIKVTSDETYERISGTSLGGGTLWGLLSLLTSAKDYDAMIEMSKKGDNKNVDMLVSDIYGGDYRKIGLKGTTIASSFGKVFKTPLDERRQGAFKEEDMALSLLYLVSNNIGQIAYLNAQAHGIQRIYFSGFFIRGHPLTMNTLSYAISFWSKNCMNALFLRHEGYLGALGAFLRHNPVAPRLGSFTENFSQIQKISGSFLGAVGSLEEDTTSLVRFPLLRDPSAYKPDTSDLSDTELQSYWINLLDVSLDHLTQVAVTRQHQESVKQCEGDSSSIVERAKTFENMYRQHLRRLRKEPNVYGALTVRALLNLREQCLREMGFNDIFSDIKKEENDVSLTGFAALIKKLDELPESDRLEQLIDNMLAGNMYDWGSAAIQDLLTKGDLDFNSARKKVGRPAQWNMADEFKTKLLVTKHVYRKTIIFVDNSGADIMFGIIPFARFLVSNNVTSVVLAANTYPAVNDITARELQDILEKCSKLDPIIENAVSSKRLSAVGTGSGSPCLDLLRVSEDIAKEAMDADLVILEGMGRALHTNFYARFNVDSLKVAVFKNPQISKELGAEMYDGIFIFEQI